ncbi:hypothetical protein [Cytobacillus firmus]|uniref:hypothetical protein n=1 Tax=Cytobacillus firmus TaxID=1399 RepID=UPI002161E01D|nr:hypothetical protein [Cytobacillus firmus]
MPFNELFSIGAFLKNPHSVSIIKEEVFCLLKSNENLLQGQEKPTKIILDFEIVPGGNMPDDKKNLKRRGVILCRGPYGF